MKKVKDLSSLVPLQPPKMVVMMIIYNTLKLGQPCAAGRNLLKEETHKLTAASNADDEEDPIASDDETAKNEMYIEDDEVSTQEWTF